MTKIYKAENKPKPPQRAPRNYEINPQAQALLSRRGASPAIPLGVMNDQRDPNRGTYTTLEGSQFDLLIRVYDSKSQKPVKSVEINCGKERDFTDSTGKVFFRDIPRGMNGVSIEGGFIETGSFSPTPLSFDPISFQIDLDSDENVSVYIPQVRGEPASIVMGSHSSDLATPNPGNPNSSQMDISLFIQENWQLLALIGGTGVIAYFGGKSNSKDK